MWASDEQFKHQVEQVLEIPSALDRGLRPDPSELSGAFSAGRSGSAPLSTEDMAGLMTMRTDRYKEFTLNLISVLRVMDEKIQVLSTASDAMTMEMHRLDSIFPHVANEISEVARTGSKTHWAYKEIQLPAPVTKPERSRREVAATNTLAAAAAALEGGKSGSRRDNTNSKKHKLKDVDQESELARPVFVRQQSTATGKTKSAGSSKTKKVAESQVGLGISNAAPAPKKRKTESGPVKGSFPVSTPSSKQGTRSGSTPNLGASKAAVPSRSTKVVEEPKPKKIQEPTVAKKRATPAPRTPTPIASSPVTAAFPVFVPAEPSHTLAPSSITTLQPTEITDPVRPRESSSASTVKDPAIPSADTTQVEPQPMEGIEQEAQPAILPKRTSSSRSPKKESIEIDDTSRSIDRPRRPTISTNGYSSRAGSSSKSSAASPATTKAPQDPRTRVSKRSKAAELAAAKRSHKKGAAAVYRALQAVKANGVIQSVEDQEAMATLGEELAETLEEEGEEELRYCYCGGVSYGEMVGCDNDNCTKEWFHLGCIGLKSPPKGCKFPRRSCAVGV